ncbi:MAG TPA: formate dehydrogenase subunit alpha [Rhizomicrobium sp.]|nr:formate dehydrogenase subunit alpha [Rhizomicrobium sp.]
MLRAAIDGTEFQFASEISILAAAKQHGIAIPALCFDPRLDPIGSCRICCVEVEGEPHPQIACRTPIRDGMRVTTHSPALEAFRRELLEWMAARVPPASFASDPDKELHGLMRAYAVEPAGKARAGIDASHPYIRVDMSQCIQCLRCVRICDDLQGEFVWHALSRGDDQTIVPDSGTTLEASSCVGCGACSDTCPTGALVDKQRRKANAATSATRTTCAYCGVGCELEAVVSDGRLVEARPVLDAPVSKGHLCVKGRYAFGYVHASDRQTRPLLRERGKWVPTSWDGALDRCAGALQRIVARYGPDSVGVLGSARATNEENYLAQKFARVVLGTNNVDCCGRVCHTPSAAALKSMLGAGAATNSFDDIERAAAIFVCGANPLENHPVVGARIRQQVLRHGTALVVADPRRTEIARAATLHLALRPGTNIPLLNAMAHVIIAENLADGDFLQRRVADFERFAASVASWSPERAAGICEVPADDIRAAARLYATRRPAMTFHGLGLTEHLQGTEGVMALINLALLTGNLGKPGTGVNPLRGQNNVQGAAHMGCDPSVLTGSVPIQENAARFGAMWGATISRSHGLHLLQMMDAALAGRLKALWVVGYDVLPTLANVQVMRRALEKLEFVIVQDLFMTKTAQAVGGVFLPAASSFEKDGTFMNGERRIQRVRKAIDPPGEARSDWEIIAALAARMGHAEQFRYASAQDIWNEIRNVWPEAAGISYARLEHGGLQWPCPDESHPGTAILHATKFGRRERAALEPIQYVPSPETTSEQFPFVLTTGRTLYQFNVGSMSRRTPNTRLRPTDTLDIAPPDACALGLENGEIARVTSAHGSAQLTVRVSAAMKAGEVFASFQDPRIWLNRLTGPVRDRVVQAPEYKVTAVAIEKAPAGRRKQGTSARPA